MLKENDRVKTSQSGNCKRAQRHGCGENCKWKKVERSRVSLERSRGHSIKYTIIRYVAGSIHPRNNLITFLNKYPHRIVNFFYSFKSLDIYNGIKI